ncbi:MAG: carboxypeptidase-like regulatory domain-containing protein, partial [Pyrinomonadaceae bacterium]
MKKNLFSVALFAIFALFSVTAGLAQTNTTGAVEGVVVDTNGAVVPNASVTISGPNLISAQTTTSNENGIYRFLQIPPGRYSVSTSPIAGFTAFKRDSIDVSLGQTTPVKIELSTGGVTGVVDVVAGSDIDVGSNTTG